MTSYILRPRSPRRALLLGAVLAVIGLVVLVAGIQASWAAVLPILGAALLACGLAVGVLAAYSMTHHSTHIDLDARGFHVHGPGMDRKGSWAHVTRVALTPDGSRLVIASGPIKRTFIICPNGGDDPVMKALIADITTRVGEIAR